MTESLTSDEIRRFAVWSASALLQSDAGKKAGYWEKSLFGKPHVTGSAYVIGTYTQFILGCPLAGLLELPPDGGSRIFIPDAESLGTYYIEVPTIKEILDAHFRDSDEYAANTLSPELRAMIGDTRQVMLSTASPESGRRDEILMSILWNLYRQAKPLSIEDAIEGFANAFMYGASIDPGEVERLWGVQARATVVPIMDHPLDDARSEAVADVKGHVSASATVSHQYNDTHVAPTHPPKTNPLFVGLDIPWKKIEGEVLRVLAFTPLASVEEGRIKGASIPNPYALLDIESPILKLPARMPVNHRVDFLKLWQLYRQAGLADFDGEVLVTWVQYRGFLGTCAPAASSPTPPYPQASRRA